MKSDKCVFCNKKSVRRNMCEPHYKKELGEVELVPVAKKAKCGHYSTTRYFKCEKCQPDLCLESWMSAYACLV